VSTAATGVPSSSGGPWPRGVREALVLLAMEIACFAVAAGGALVTAPAVTGWYQGITKPSFNPPAWIFGPVWTLLYALMGWAAFLAWRRSGLRSRPLAFFGVQLLLNGVWSPVFFGLGRPGAALVIIAALWAAIVLTLFAFWRVERLAGALFVPYLAWVSFAAVLNAAIWRLNPHLG
jgi:benzodiazapine receptor